MQALKASACAIEPTQKQEKERASERQKRRLKTTRAKKALKSVLKPTKRAFSERQKTCAKSSVKEASGKEESESVKRSNHETH
ncbi:hypothetical protein Hac_1604 [Helicobacter acinonychis str. Sheeba]|uniref:Uncharacterized protein n=1 Tax=Helicobacter acinonychis (strain Sheeba) TaxID=382638 RepID=Q17VL2_HELAH|nr:hypothetical protein Hac_1604 [Helicobacter acinonychis str. Sheeba]